MGASLHRYRLVHTTEEEAEEEEAMIAEFQQQVADLQQKITELQQKIAELQHQVADRDQQVAELQRQVADRDQQVAELQRQNEREMNLDASFIDGKTCTICMEALPCGILGRAACWHVFHVDCMRIAHMYSRKCPTCRGDMTIMYKCRVLPRTATAGGPAAPDAIGPSPRDQDG
jgi:cell division protein FtsL